MEAKKAVGRGRRHQDAARQMVAVRQRPLHDDAAHRVADQNRRAGAAFGRLENVTDIVVDAEVMKAAAPLAPAMSAQGDRMRLVATGGEPRQELFRPDPGAAEGAMDEQERDGLGGAGGGVREDFQIRHGLFVREGKQSGLVMT